MPRQLTISPTPYKSSFLAIPPTPFSPLLPITPTFSPPKHTQTTHDRTAKLTATAALLPPPPEPLHWLWQCHRCNRVYQLGVTRRCLDDGHFFCAGSTVIKRSKKHNYKKVVRHQACASEFDYQGWKAWGCWRRGLREQVEAAEALMWVEEGLGLGTMEEGRWFSGSWARGREKEKKDCWGRCDYPSECRWGKQFGVQTPKTTTTTTVVPSTVKEEERLAVVKEEPKTSFDDILLSISDPASPDYLVPLAPSKSTAQTTPSPLEPDTAAPSMDDLLQSAKRRKRRSSGQIPLIPSPLGANPPSPEKEEKPVLRKSASSSALATLEEGDLGKKGPAFEGLGELREKADEFMRSLRAARVKLQTGSM